MAKEKSLDKKPFSRRIDELMKLNKTFFLGFLGGSLLTLGLMLLTRLSNPPSGEKILAEMDGEFLTETEFRKGIGNDLVPIENDEYLVLEKGLTEWLEKRLLEKEAKVQGFTVEELYQKEIWSRIRISYDRILEYYNQNKEVYGESFEKVSRFLARELRENEYIRRKEGYLSTLREKYNVQIHLEKPKSFVEGLALGGIPVGTGMTLPTAPAGSSERKSEIGAAPSLGPDDAKITLTEFSDFHCSFCKMAAPTLKQVLNHYAGQVRWVFRHYPLSKTPGSGSFLTHEAAACAQEQGKFWEFHDGVFALPSVPQESDLQKIAGDIGLDKGRFQECIQSKRYQNTIEQDAAEGTRRGVQGTPTVFVNDQMVAGAYPFEYFVSVIEGILDPSKAAAVPATPPAPPAVVQFDDLEGRPSQGPQDAPITVVEFSDFYCPFCKRVAPTLEALIRNYPGKVRRIWRHYPLAFHTGADRVHEASECAHEQGKFWAYHDKLFRGEGSPFDDAALIRLAKELELDKKKFENCLVSGKYKDLIQREISKGQQIGVDGTPAVFVNGQLVSGAQPYENFDQIIRDKLAAT